MSHIYPLIRPVITDSDPDTLHSVWFLLDEVNGTYDSKSGIVAKSKHWLRNHLEITNVDHELVVPIRVTRGEYIAFFSPEAKEEPEEGTEAFLRARYKEQSPEAQPFGDAKSATKRMKATYHPVVHKQGTQEYLPQEGQGEEVM